MDTNPIFLFSMLAIEAETAPALPQEDNSDITNSSVLAEKAEASLRLPDTQSAVAVRSALAAQYVAAGTECVKESEALIHDQHLMHQGWQAVVANLEDTAVDLGKGLEGFRRKFDHYLAQREENQVLQGF